MKKKLSIVLTVLLLTLTAQSDFASDRIESVQVEQLPDGSCFVTVIEEVPQIETQTMAAKTTTKTKSKTVYYKNRNLKLQSYRHLLLKQHKKQYHRTDFYLNQFFE